MPFTRPELYESCKLPPRTLLSMTFLVIVLALAAVIWIVQSQRKPSRPARQRPTSPSKAPVFPADSIPIPAAFPVQAKQYFFSRSEHAFYEMLLEALSGSAYTVFPNVRLNDLMLIKASGSERQAVLGRLRDKHVDFLIVERGQYKPMLGIELDGASHENDKQQYRDAVKDTLFASARLPLIRLDARQRRQPSELRLLVHCHISAALP